MASLVIFGVFLGIECGMANLGLIYFKISFHIKINVTVGQNKFEVHVYQNSDQLAQNRPDATLAHGH